MKALLTSVIILVSNATWAEPPALNCDQGPAHKIFGGTPWLIYACNDKRSVVAVTAEGSPAAEFYFMFTYSNDTYRLYGEGTGNKAKTDEAYGQLSKLTENEIEDLYVEASSAVK